MGIDELTLSLGGELVANVARVRRDGKWLVLGSIVGNQWQATEIGQRLLEAAAKPVAEDPVEPKPVVRRGRPRRDDLGLS